MGRCEIPKRWQTLGAVPVQKKDSKAAFEVLLKTVWANPHTVNIQIGYSVVFLVLYSGIKQEIFLVL